MEYRAYLMKLKKDHITDYADIHKKEKIWQGVVDGLKKSGFLKMIILQMGQDVILFEEAEDLKKTYSVLGRHEESVRWDEMIFEWMEQYPEWDEIKEHLDCREVSVVFYFENGIMKH